MARWLSWWSGLVGSLFLISSLSAAPLTIYTEQLPPLNFTDNNKLTGLSVDMVEEIKRRVKLDEPIQLVPWARGYKAALEQENVVLFSTTRTEEREKQFKWVGPLTRWSYVFYKKRGSPITLKTLDDARKVGAIATYRDDAREQFLKEKGFFNLDSSPKLISCARKLMEGRVDLWLDSNLTAHQVVKNAGYDPADLEPVLTVRTNHLYIAFSLKTDDVIVAKWQEALNAMVEDGTYQQIYQNWLPKERPPIIASLTPTLLKQLEEVKIFTEELPPLNFVEQGNVTGVNTEIVHEVLRRIGLTTDIEVLPWARGYKSALEQPMVALYSTVRSPNRERLFKWVGPIAESSSELYAKRGADIRIHNLEQAKQVDSIGTYNDDVDEQFLKDLGFKNIYSHSSPTSAVRNLMNGRIKLWIASRLYVHETVNSAGYACEDVQSVFTIRKTYFYIAFSKQTPDAVVDVWQQTLDLMRRDGSIAEIQQRWHAKLNKDESLRGCRVSNSG